MRRFFFSFAAALAAGAAGLAGCGKAGDPPGRDGPEWATLDGRAPLVIAHRGASGYLPEHTLEAYALAIEQGADIIEPDLVITKDGVLIARHDRYLSTTTNVADRPAFADRRRIDPDPNGNGRADWWVEDFTLAEINTLRARQPRKGRPQEYNGLYAVPTFAEVLALAAKEAQETGRPVGVYPETKHPGYFAGIGLDFEAPLLAALDGFDAGPVFIQSFEPDILKRLKGKSPHRLVQLVYEETPGAGPHLPLSEVAAYAHAVGPQKSLLHDSADGPGAFVSEAHALGLAVHPWTFRDDAPSAVVSALCGPGAPAPEQECGGAADIGEIEYAIFYRSGVDGVFSDFPDTAVRVRDAMSGAAPEARD